MKENIINIPRGTSWVGALVITDENGNVHYDPDDTVTFGVKRDPNDSSYTITKPLTYNTDEECYIVKLDPDDTIGLVQDERYWYDIGLQTTDGDFFQVIETTYFNVLKAVTKAVST